jgi:hypothetical protein
MLWIVVFDTAAILWLGTETSLDFEARKLALFGLLAVELAVWDGAALGFRLPWLQSRWGARALALFAAFLITTLLIDDSFKTLLIDDSSETLSDRSRSLSFTQMLLAWFVWLAALWFVYRKWRQDVFMLACGVFSVAIGLPPVILFRGLFERDLFDTDGVFMTAILIFMGGILMLALSACGGFWLKKIVNESRKEKP